MQRTHLHENRNPLYARIYSRYKRVNIARLIIQDPGRPETCIYVFRMYILYILYVYKLCNIEFII